MDNTTDKNAVIENNENSNNYENESDSAEYQRYVTAGGYESFDSNQISQMKKMDSISSSESYNSLLYKHSNITEDFPEVLTNRSRNKSNQKEKRKTSQELLDAPPCNIFSNAPASQEAPEIPRLNLDGDESISITFPVGKILSHHKLYIDTLQAAINNNWNMFKYNHNSIDLTLDSALKTTRETLKTGTNSSTQPSSDTNDYTDFYHTLESLNRNLERVNIYVMVLEMIQTVSPNSDSNYFHTINYKVTDPSVFNNEKFAKVDFSLQLKFNIHPGNGLNCEDKDCNCHFHVSSGDIIRAKRVKVKYKSDSNGFVHVNLYIISKITSIRLWNLDSEKTNVIYNGIKTTMTEYDSDRIKTLKEFAKRILSENELLCVASYMSTLDNITPIPQDYLCFVTYTDNTSIHVIDKPYQVPVKVTFSLLIAKNVLESKNPIVSGNWVKLRSFRKSMDPNIIGSCLSCSDIARITRLWEGCKEIVTLKETFAKDNEFFKVDNNITCRSIGKPSLIHRQRPSSRSGNLIDKVENTRPSLISEARRFSSIFPVNGVNHFPERLTGLKRPTRTQSSELEEGEIIAL